MSKKSVSKIFSLVLLVGFIAVVPSYPTGIEIEPDGWAVSPLSEVPADGAPAEDTELSSDGLVIPSPAPHRTGETLATGIEIEPDGWGSGPQQPQAPGQPI